MVEEADFAATVGTVLALHGAKAVRVQARLKDAVGVLTRVTLGTEAGVATCKHAGVKRGAWVREGRAGVAPGESQRWWQAGERTGTRGTPGSCS